MTFSEMIYKVETGNGTGVIFHYTDGTRIIYFYENFCGGSSGIARAQSAFHDLLKAGKVSKADYYHKNSIHPFAIPGEKVIIHIYDTMHNYTEIKTTEYNRPHDVIRQNGQTGIIWGNNTEFVPLSGFAGNVRFEIL